MSIFARLQNIDRRILYLLIAVVIAVPLMMRPSAHPSVILPEVRGAYKTINTVPRDKVVIISVVWGAGTLAENGPQTEALMRHLFRNGTKFVVVSWDQVGNELSYDIGVKLQKEMHKTYGTDWVHLGYNPGPIYTVISGAGKDFKGVFRRDRFNTDLSKLPVTANVKDHNQIGAVAEITPSGTLETSIAYFNMPYKIPLVYCPTAVMAARRTSIWTRIRLRGCLTE